MESRTDKLLSFLKEIEKFKKIEREIFYADVDRQETDAEHAWHLAMFLILFEKDLPQDADLKKMLKLALMHDLVEIYAGDTFAFDKEAKKNQKEREMDAAKKLFSQLPDDLEKEFMDLFIEFEEEKTKEAQIVQSFDKLQPMLQNIIADGKAWKKNNVTYKDIEDYKRKRMEHNEFILGIYTKLLAEAKDKKLI